MSECKSAAHISCSLAFLHTYLKFGKALAGRFLLPSRPGGHTASFVFHVCWPLKLDFSFSRNRVLIAMIGNETKHPHRRQRTQLLLKSVGIPRFDEFFPKSPFHGFMLVVDSSHSPCTEISYRDFFFFNRVRWRRGCQRYDVIPPSGLQFHDSSMPCPFLDKEHSPRPSRTS